MTFALVKAKVEARDPNSFVGSFEGLLLDAKLIPYNLDEPDQRYELAKDVSAFANADGGFILLGFDEDREDPTRSRPVVKSVNPFPAERLPIGNYYGMLKHYIHPEIEGLVIHWLPDSTNPLNGVGIIEVPPQLQERKYFLISNVVENGEEIGQIVFGLVQRVDDNNQPMTRTDLYNLMQHGKHEVPTLLRQMDGKIDALLRHETSQATGSQSAKTRIQERLNRVESGT
ncbi:MAG TPA: RNA-binding domain-containing protein [Candidatus Acidoferrum sp.]|nr:RNA-binding domain-containing protein [Candidatus Acidoferrum sp.]